MKKHLPLFTPGLPTLGPFAAAGGSDPALTPDAATLPTPIIIHTAPGV
jgi:hypothetical protein